MGIQTQRMTLEEFEHFIAIPENTGRSFEYIGGEAIQVVSNNYSSLVGAQIVIELGSYVKRHALGYVTSADGGYVVMGERYIPDVAFISKARQPRPSHEPYNSNAPDLAVEVLSPTDDPAFVRIKIVNYLRAGTVVWVVDPIRRRVEIYTPDQAPRAVGVDDVLDGGDVLPDFTLTVSEIFPD
jgi:Uma2 family endonuclease